MSEDEKASDVDNRNWDLEYSSLGSLVTLYKDLSPLTAIYKDLSSVAAIYKNLEYQNLGSYAMAAEALSSYNTSILAVASEAAKSYNSNLSAMAEVSESYNSDLFSMANDVLRSSTLSSITAISEAFESATLDSIAGMSGVLKDFSTLHLSIISEALTSTNVCSSVTFGNKNFLEILPVEETKVLSLNAEDPRQIFPNSKSNFKRTEYSIDLVRETRSDYEISDFKINCEAYSFLCNLEIYLRHLIKNRVIEPHEKNLKNRIPQDILSRWEERKNQDSVSDYDLIDYSDFTDLKIIFEKGKNKDLFKDLFNYEEYKALTTKLHELDPIRKKIAHFRPLTENDFSRLVLYHDDIFSFINNRQR